MTDVPNRSSEGGLEDPRGGGVGDAVAEDVGVRLRRPRGVSAGDVDGDCDRRLLPRSTHSINIL